MNRHPAPGGGHPLRMMSADYDSSSREQGFQGNFRQSGNHPNPPRPRQHGGFSKGKGRKGGYNNHNDASDIQSYILPEMLIDPWIGLYHTLPDGVRSRETKHLSDAEKDRVESCVSMNPPTKRYNQQS